MDTGSSPAHGAARWPGISWEPQTWVPAAAGVGGRSASRAGRYESALPAHIAEHVPDPNREVLQLAQEASNELTRLDAQIGHKVARFAPVLLRSESASSSQIENLTASARAIFSAELGVKKSRNALSIAANTQAMTAALQLAESISSTSILEMHRGHAGRGARWWGSRDPDGKRAGALPLGPLGGCGSASPAAAGLPGFLLTAAGPVRDPSARIDVLEDQERLGI